VNWADFAVTWTLENFEGFPALKESQSLERKKRKGEIEIIEDVFKCDFKESRFRLFHA
jgi:hypothetical protein